MGFSAHSIESWKILADLLLMASLMWLCLRLWRSPTANPRQIIELEGSLRSLLREADHASRSLNDQLLKRQDALEKLLLDMGSTEARLQRAALGVDETKRMVDLSLARAQKIIQALDASASEAVIPAGPRSPSSSHVPERIETARTPLLEEPPVPDFRQSVISQSEENPSSRSKPRSSDSPLKNFGQEPRKTSTLHQSIEREVIPQSLNSVYDAAEEMIRAGKDVEMISARTNLSFDEIRMLSEIVAREKRPTRSDATEDSLPNEERKLGALGPMKRSIQTL